MEKIRIGISSCLLGAKVRFDGQHKQDSYITGTLSHWFEFVPVCPEVELGLGIPRETIRLEGDPENPRLVKTKSGEDLTDSMKAYCRKRVAALSKEELGGYILKSRSPSCGMERVKVYSKKGMPSNKGRGIYADELVKRFPLIPVEEEGRLNDPALRERFIEQVFTLQRWRRMLQESNTRGGLVKFHEQHKYLLMAHSVQYYRAMGRLVAEMKGMKLATVQEEYLEMLMSALRLRATTAKHVNVLQHLTGYFKKQLNSDEKQELQETVAAYKSGHFPLIVPVTLLNHYIRKYDESYLKQQVYLKPGPTELRLRNQIY
ncbi:YbgA family protein [Pontiella agarivorans]|uniref:DUF523 and DUF1722 domain-containing protein n=1 Tax=Pontiella agarivorans TaxID=3038953 RepID=A0ABU5MUD3_9BACT|nr:DUF523 and DUF1722 domain-containing protein [Pontiella agarivorans]MDZ8117581.1 DUF523 and DUF1722 domain-containing protein [Pontiella agarivorans]